MTHICICWFLGVGNLTKNALTGPLYYLKTASRVDSRCSECKHFSHTETHARTHTHTHNVHRNPTCADKLDVELVFPERVACRAAEHGVIQGCAHVHHSHRAGVDGAVPRGPLFVPAASTRARKAQTQSRRSGTPSRRLH